LHLQLATAFGVKKLMQEKFVEFQSTKRRIFCF